MGRCCIKDVFKNTHHPLHKSACYKMLTLQKQWGHDTYVDLMVIQRSCSSFRVSVKRVSPARAEAMMPAFDTSESVRVDFPWSTCAITDMLRMLAFLSMMARIWSTVKFTWGGKIKLEHSQKEETQTPDKSEKRSQRSLNIHQPRISPL